MAYVVSAQRALKEKQINLKQAAQSVALAIAIGTGVVSVPPHAAYAQSHSFSSVAIEGNQRVEAATILSYAGIARGQSVSEAELNDAYQRLAASGLFETVELVPQGSKLVIRVAEYPTVNKINFEGNRRIKDDDLSAIVQSQSRRVFSPRTAEEDAQRISEAYGVQGRIAARVMPKIIRRSDNRVDLVFEVFEGGVSEIERIGFQGNDVYSDRRLRRVLETKQAGLLRAVIQKDTFIEDRIEFDKQLLQDFYMARGYVDFRVRGVNSELAQERDGYFVSFNVEEGQQFHVGEVTVQSDLPDVDVDLFQSKVKLRQGVVYSPNRVENEIARLERLAVKEGLNFVRVEPRVNRNDRDLTLDVEFLLTRGPRVFVERIDIEGNSTTVDRVIRQQFDVVEGDPFNPRAIRQSAERIRALGFFKTAEVEAREGSTPQQVIVDVEVEEQPTGSLSFGAAYSTTSGIAGNVSFSETNFLGRGQLLDVTVSAGATNKNYKFNFAEPAFLGRDLLFGVALDYNESNTLSADYDINTGSFTPYLSFPVSDNGRLALRYATNYTDIKLNKATNLGGVLIADAGRGATYDNGIGYTYSYDTRRTGLNPNAGVLLEFGQDFSVGKQRNFVKTSAKAVAQTKVLSEEVTLRAGFEGAALAFSKGNSRITDRFLLSPDQMRGFEYGGIGPREINGGNSDSLGGEYYAVLKFEAEFPIGLPEEYGISGGVFYDVGAVWGAGNTSAATGTIVSDKFDARHVVGVSVLWDSAFGPLRLNFSEPVKKRKEDKELNFNLAIKTEF
ncbi:MAG: outer membrane protein assembly factor BamA [Pelagimonas sp.]|nr:outer membrane protein assembly factor BamA [Pelagimonas sp.]